ncbi:hypothetical protein [Hymenobacter daeguensis]
MRASKSRKPLNEFVLDTIKAEGNAHKVMVPKNINIERLIGLRGNAAVNRNAANGIVSTEAKADSKKAAMLVNSPLENWLGLSVNTG